VMLELEFGIIFVCVVVDPVNLGSGLKGPPRFAGNLLE
jgi:hypothetical protein